MSSRRTVVLLAAIVVGVLAAVVVWNYVNAADSRATGKAAQVSVWVVKQDIPRGTTGADAIDQHYIQQDEIPTRFKPNTAITDLETIRTFVAAIDIPANSQLVSGMFVTKEAAVIGNSELLKNGRVAITINVDPVRGVAGLIVPGDFVNILVNASPEDSNLCEVATDKENPPPPELITPITPPQQKDRILLCTPAHYLFQKVQVLFVDKTTVPQPGATPTEAATADGTPAPTVQAGLITFAVPPQAAQLIASVPGERIYLTLVGPDYAPIALPPLDPFPVLLPGEDPNQLTPYGPAGLPPD